MRAGTTLVIAILLLAVLAALELESACVDGDAPLV